MMDEFLISGTQPAAARSAHAINRQVRRMERPYKRAYSYDGDEINRQARQGWQTYGYASSYDIGRETSGSFWLELLLALAVGLGGGDE